MTRTALALVATLAACVPQEDPAQPEPSFTAPAVSASARIAWRAQVDPSATGIALDGEDILVMHNHGSLERISLASGQRSRIDVDIFDATDMASVGDGRFVVTVPGDGLLFDPVQAEATQHFCYEPGFMDEQMWELTDAVAVDPAGAGVIYAAPQTFQGGQAIASAIGVWDLETGGEPTGWYTLPWPSFTADGMAVDGPDALLLGHQSMLLGYTLGGEPPAGLVDLADLGVSDITGLALDADDALLVLDSTGDLLRITDWR